MMRRSITLGALLTVGAGLGAMLLSGCEVGGDVVATANGASTVNGSIHVPAGLHSGSVSTVNGSIHIAENATVASASTVNGGIDLGAHASADSLSTVNGGVTLDDASHVTKAVGTVNGGLTLRTGADVGGTAGNVNGAIVLTNAHVAGGLRTVSGDIDITDGSHVEGGIRVEKSGGWFNWNPRKPRIVIGPNSVVQGDLRFERDVDLYVSDKATTGPIIGATAVSFSGDKPPG
jgi:DUF4097 and DUF4098 domain-containing protein YvlB